jgi:hypothetical protein
MQEKPAPVADQAKRQAAERARKRFEARNARLQRERETREAGLAASREAAAEARKRATIQKAIARAHARLQQRGR